MKEQEIKIPVINGHKSLLHYFAHYMEEERKGDGIPVRFVVAKTDNEHYYCETGILDASTKENRFNEPIFRFKIGRASCRERV